MHLSTPFRRSALTLGLSLTLSAGLALMSGCASTGSGEKLAFTDGLASEYKLGNEQKRLLQYYVSDTIRLVRGGSSGQTGIRDGLLVSNSERAVDQIVIDGGTPGVVLASGTNWVAVSFAPGSYLYFVSKAQQRATWIGDEYVDDRYYLYLPDWNGQVGTVRLGDALYAATDDSYRAYLVVGRENFSRVDTRQAKLPGRYLKQ